MKILVIDDNQSHLDAAKAQLSSFDLTTVGSYDEGQKLLQDPHDFDVVLVDLLLPASGDKQGPEGSKFVGQEMPIGIFLALLAAKNGAKRVAIHSDSDHHAHPASACMNAFSRCSRESNGETYWSHDEQEPRPFEVAGAKIILSNNRNWVTNVNPNNLTEKVEYSFATGRAVLGEHVRVKNWKGVLDYLLTL